MNLTISITNQEKHKTFLNSEFQHYLLKLSKRVVMNEAFCDIVTADIIRCLELTGYSNEHHRIVCGLLSILGLLLAYETTSLNSHSRVLTIYYFIVNSRIPCEQEAEVFYYFMDSLQLILLKVFPNSHIVDFEDCIAQISKCSDSLQFSKMKSILKFNEKSATLIKILCTTCEALTPSKDTLTFLLSFLNRFVTSNICSLIKNEEILFVLIQKDGLGKQKQVEVTREKSNPLLMIDSSIWNPNTNFRRTESGNTEDETRGLLSKLVIYMEALYQFLLKFSIDVSSGKQLFLSLFSYMQTELGIDFTFYVGLLQRFIYLNSSFIEFNNLLKEYSSLIEGKKKRNSSFEELLLLSKYLKNFENEKVKVLVLSFHLAYQEISNPDEVSTEIRKLALRASSDLTEYSKTDFMHFLSRQGSNALSFVEIASGHYLHKSPLHLPQRVDTLRSIESLKLGKLQEMNLFLLNYN